MLLSGAERAGAAALGAVCWAVPAPAISMNKPASTPANGRQRVIRNPEGLVMRLRRLRGRKVPKQFECSRAAPFAGYDGSGVGGKYRLRVKLTFPAPHHH